jgi:hypothetical protein
MTSDQIDSSNRARAGTAHEVESILDSLKGIVAITMGLALTNTIVVLVTHGTYTSIAKLSSLHVWAIVCSAAVIASIIRFYHGNNRFMDSNYAPWVPTETRGRGRAPRGGLGVDFLVIFAQSVLFAVISFYSAPRRELLLLFDVLLVFDIFWYLTTVQVERDSRAQKYHRRWMQNNLGFGLLILVTYFEYLQHGHARGWLYAGAVLIACNTLRDFIISWDLYFGSYAQSTQAIRQPREIHASVSGKEE